MQKNLLKNLHQIILININLATLKLLDRLKN